MFKLSDSAWEKISSFVNEILEVEVGNYNEQLRDETSENLAIIIRELEDMQIVISWFETSIKDALNAAEDIRSSVF